MTKKKAHRKKVQPEKRELIIKEEDQAYAYVTDVLGNARFRCLCDDLTSRLGHLRGKIRRRTRLGRGDYVLVSLRDFQDDKCDILHKYTEEEVHILRKKKLMEKFVFNDNEESEDEVVFTYEIDDEKEVSDAFLDNI